MKKLLFVAIGMLMLAGCTKSQVNDAACKAQDAVVSAVSAKVVAVLACSNAAAVQADVLAIVSKTKICTPPSGNTTGPIGDALCPGIVSGIVGVGTGKIPPTWGCTGGTLAADAQAELLALCKANISI